MPRSRSSDSSTSSGSRFISGSRLLFWFAPVTIALSVIGYADGVVFAFSTSTPATRRSIAESGRHLGGSGASGLSGDEVGWSDIGGPPSAAQVSTASSAFCTGCRAASKPPRRRSPLAVSAGTI